MSELNYELLRQAVEGDGIALRSVMKLEPIGGPGSKVFPPTFGDTMEVPPPTEGDSALVGKRTKYALEWRRIDGRSRLCVLLDSAASQANRMEEALRDAWEAGDLPFPLVRVDFTAERHEDPALDLATLGGNGYLSVLDVPHRLSDALLRDSLLDGVPFRASAPGRRFTEASLANAVALYELCPTGLIFGLWDSTGPKGGLGAKFQRALVSEIVGVGVELGVKTASRIDPAGIEKTEIYEAENHDEEWTIDPDAAKREGKKPVLLKRGGEKAGTPAVINHGNVKPSVDPLAGGVTIDYAEQTTVLSFPALRRLRFQADVTGQLLNGRRASAEAAARTALAALAVAAVVYGRRNGFDLRSRCAFRPLHEAKFELLRADGSEPKTYDVSLAAARDLVHEAVRQAEAVGMGWKAQTIDLKPAPRLVALIRKSREISVSATGADDADDNG